MLSQLARAHEDLLAPDPLTLVVPVGIILGNVALQVGLVRQHVATELAFHADIHGGRKDALQGGNERNIEV